MRIVNYYLVESLLGPFAGLSDEERSSLMTVDPNDEEAVRLIIRTLIKPEYGRYGPKSKQIVKDTIRYMLSTDNMPFERVFYSNMPPFDLPTEQRSFFIWLWKELFGNEDFGLDITEEYVVQDNFDASNLAYIR